MAGHHFSPDHGNAAKPSGKIHKTKNSRVLKMNLQSSGQFS